MEVNIAGERISLTVPFSRQEAVRKTEGELAMLYKEWGVKFPKKTPKELLAMMAYRFASSYFDLVEAWALTTDEVQDLLDDASRLCGDTLPEAESEEFPLY